jgi:eukaryotic-like serine/threonine-protein kinase
MNPPPSQTTVDPERLRELFDAACDLDGAERATLLDKACGGQPALRATLEKLLGTDRDGGAGTLWNTPAMMIEAGRIAADSRLPFKTLGEYRILLPLAMGGMGAVYLAERDYDGVRRKVAIKIIPRFLLDDDMLWRFLRERQILARLEHPNIARMLDAGRTPDGMPYLVMDYVDGLPLDRYASSRRLDLKARLALFQAVCGAVSYAHRHLIVHRDLKPQNIFVTAEGVPKLLDFGIAKIMSAADPDSESPATKPLFAMTLDYASPEQVRGLPVSAGSDIYALGVILYELLARAKPYSLESKSLEEIVRAACDEDPPPPASHNRALTGDLDAIIRKSMRKRAEERYASVEELSLDLARYMAGEPVSASGLSIGYLARKYVARHRSQAIAIGAAALLAVAGIASVAWEAHVVNGERAKAQRRFDDLRRFANDVVFETNDNLARLPGTTVSRKALVTRGLEYLDALSKESGGDPGLEREVGAAYQRVGDIQGDRGQANLGDRKGALASYLKARAILSRASAGRSDELEATLSLIQVNERLSVLYRASGSPAESKNAVEQAVSLAERAARSNPNNARARQSLAVAYFFLASYQTDMLQNEGSDQAGKSYQKAIDTWNKCLNIYMEFLKASPAGDGEMRNVALAHKNLADMLRDKNQALEHALQAEQLDSKRMAAHPLNVEAQLDLSYDLDQTGNAYMDTGNPRKALESYLGALAIRRRLSDGDPLDMRKRTGLLYTESLVGDALLRLGSSREAYREYQKAAAIGAAQVARHPEETTTRYLAHVYRGMGEAASHLGRRGEGCDWWRRAIAIYPKVAAEKPARLAACPNK